MQTFCRKKQNFLLKKERPGRKIPPGLCSVSVGMLFRRLAALAQAFEQEAGKAVTPEQLISLPSQIGECEVYWDEKAQNIHFITRNGKRIQKFVIAFNYKTKIQGEKVNVNAFITAGNIDERVLKMQNMMKIK